MSGRKSPWSCDLPCAGDDYHIADPAGHVAPGTAICLLALGLMEHDGVVIDIGFVTAALALTIVTIASAGAVDAARHWLIG
jgi:hypothetical protein